MTGPVHTGRALVEVAPGVHVATSRVMATTSTVLVGPRGVLLVDPAWVPSELDALATTLDERDWRVVGGFATHAHHDHLLWHPRFGDVPRWASPRTAELARTERAALVEALGDGWPDELVDLMGRVEPAADIDEGIELVVHDGHAPGHTALWLAEQRVLVVGDMLSDREVPLPFWPDDLPAYLAGLDRLAPYVASAAVLVPGHGTPTHEPMARLDADRRYLDEVIAGRVPDDARLEDAENRSEYDHLVELVRTSG
ncbi:MBL fold metallo-hydrolase [Cellulomonas sp. PhB150]|uniref:MBL fold metallo-hydrolase n=1 Tax=Cellulomonas sp. PhB150 TaxID=2485188 RepID=UPI000FB701AA|nr:MBL fold metallo-hydrolase [Cellulomonas sp. PhB150]ROS23697.1 glyoxylase-like metal-dependent hydrolase (beta-lactamase superfamily II) [Cellulomonas sp. PhB150]